MRVVIDGLDSLSLGLEKIRAMPKDVMLKAVEEGGTAIEKSVEKTGRQYGVHRTGQTLESITQTNLIATYGGGRVDVTFKGRNKQGNRNAEVAFVNNYGVSRTSGHEQKARPFISDGVDNAADEAADSAASILFDWLEKNF